MKETVVCPCGWKGDETHSCCQRFRHTCCQGHCTPRGQRSTARLGVHSEPEGSRAGVGSSAMTPQSTLSEEGQKHHWWPHHTSSLQTNNCQQGAGRRCSVWCWARSPKHMSVHASYSMQILPQLQQNGRVCVCWRPASQVPRKTHFFL